MLLAHRLVPCNYGLLRVVLSPAHPHLHTLHGDGQRFNFSSSRSLGNTSFSWQAQELWLGGTRGNSLIRQTTQIAIEHIVASSKRSYDQVKATLEARMGFLGNTDELIRQVAGLQTSWEQITQMIEKRLGTSGFTIFSRVEQGQLLSLAGKPAGSSSTLSVIRSSRSK